ncbi:DUF6644 family protein [Dyadobacter sp. Leaf189]|uniref:DUF6644 family protein n=1 Tax=Dyadobacter sp. Leaf189 TaxID=1736295 RepID=UPI0006FE8CF1|nr:DUF6644 family protein [Dyadobacter sp. Leaf189]KQS27025.1 hypothetical protein ASG33_21050 [Dyadobacter sp. Leaf189]
MELLEWLEKSSWAVGIRQSLYLYPVLEIIHILGIVMLVGAAFLFDLRLLGYSRDLPVSGMAKYLLPWSQRGLILIIPSGLLLFITNAQALGTDFTFWLKLALIAVAALNAWIFHRFIYKITQAEGEMTALPASSRLSALVSISVWVAVIACGRLLAY